MVLWLLAVSFTLGAHGRQALPLAGAAASPLPAAAGAVAIAGVALVPSGALAVPARLPQATRLAIQPSALLRRVERLFSAGRGLGTGAAEPAGPVPADFGAQNGTEIANKGTILSEVDRALGRAKPPALEYLYVLPAVQWRLTRGAGSGANPYGHAAVRYTMPDGGQKVMNIVGKPGKEMVNFLEPADYLYGTNVFDTGSEQGGVYNRPMAGLRVEELPAETIGKLDAAYRRLRERHVEGDVAFSLALSDLWNVLGDILPGRQKERGNCARWTSCGLAAAGLLPRPTLWPKLIWVRLYEHWRRRSPGNLNVVFYRRIPHARHLASVDEPSHGLVAPLRWWRSIRYWNLERLADAVVEVPEGTTRAAVRTTGRR